MSSGGDNFISSLLHKAHNQGIQVSARPFIIAGIAGLIAFLILNPSQTLRNFEFLFLVSPLWLPPLLGYFAWQRWRTANRVEFMGEQEHVLLEILIPRDIRKTPLAMETIFTSMHLAPGVSTWWKRIVLGRVPPWYSYEIVSIGGRVHFYVWMRANLRRTLESYFYAQYPGVEIVEATDYTRLVDPTHAPYGMWGCDFLYKKEDAYPIRTYQEFMKADSPLAKPEEQVDPLAQAIEMLGSISPGEQFWFQMVVRVATDDKFASHGPGYSIQDQANDVIEALRKKTVRTVKQVAGDGSVVETESFPNPTRGVQNTMEMVERKVSKQMYDVGLRCVYVAKEDSFQSGMISSLLGFFKPVNSQNMNSLGGSHWMASYDDWPWEDRSGKMRQHTRHNLIDAYRRRSFFYEPHKVPWNIMNVEEMATLFHIPSSGVTTPSLPRIQSSTSEAPSNLPV